jgi:hypothetical protein
LACVSVLAACNRDPENPTPLEQASQTFDNFESFERLDISDEEASQLLLVRQAGITEENCLELVNLARGRGQMFVDGESIANLIRVGFRESSVMTLARLNQLGIRAGEAQVMRLAGLSDEVVLAVARRRASDQDVLSSVKAAELRNVGLTNPQILDAVNRGTTDAQADAIIAQRNRAAGGHRWVRQRGSRRR